jgi:UDP-N-acetylglucosamine--N-acetylmuramyl-(pentapeptide) pyrophosphoryl-undecaprenol N-acetylglucosamine transferase
MITAGGTGGHVFPGLAVAAKLIGRGWRVFWLGTRDGMEGALVRQHGVELEAVAFGGIRGKGWKTALLGPLALLAACWQSRRIIRRRAPDVVLGFGGFASFPGALAAIALARPLVLHDANATGLRTACRGGPPDLRAFRRDGRPACGEGRMVGNPARRDRKSACPEAPVRGGSVAAPFVGGNLARRQPVRAPALADPRPARPKSCAVRGNSDARARLRAGGRRETGALRYRRHGGAIPTTRLRGGAITVAELAAAGVASIIVPLPGAIADEQSANAQFLVAAGAALTIPQGGLSPGRLAADLGSFTRATLLAMATAARSLARPDAADRVADACVAMGARA